MIRTSSIVALLILLSSPDSEAVQADSVAGTSQAAMVSLSGSYWDPYASVELWQIPWRYHPGDDVRWARPEFDDGDWELASPTLRQRDLPKGGWTGIGWFRLRVVTDSTFGQKSLGLLGDQGGTIDVYWDGMLVADTVLYRIPTEILSGPPGVHVLAVRHVLADIERVHAEGSSGGFFLRLGDFVGSIEMLQRQRSEQMFFTAFLMAFAILHLMLFVFSPTSKANLYYTIFLALIAVATYVDIQQSYLTTDPRSAVQLLVLHRAVIPFTTIFFLRFLYSIFYERCPRQFWVLAGLMVIVGVVIVLYPVEHYDYYVYMSSIFTAEMVRVLVVAVRRHKPGAWTFAIGFILVGVFSAYDTLLDLNLMAPIGHVTNAYYFGFFGMMVAMSVHLSRDFANTSKRLVAQVQRTQEEEVARRLVEEDNKRKTRELEDARQLQLSMLPNCLNDMPGLDVCFQMKTATEVGGDYYDYRREKDGSLIIAVGDATGHGMKAGTMVSITKGLFITHDSFDDLAAFLQKCSDAVKEMKLGNLFMGLTVAKLKDDTLTVAIAGMPPVYVHRKGSGDVEEILIKNMPLGGPAVGSYEERTTKLGPGDTVLFMSDGLVERFNAEGEMFDYPNVKEAFIGSVKNSATEIAHSLEQSGADWAGETAQADDITLVVVKKKE